MIYLDHAATTPLSPEADEAMATLVERTFPEVAVGPGYEGEVRVGIRGATTGA